MTTPAAELPPINDALTPAQWSQYLATGIVQLPASPDGEPGTLLDPKGKSLRSIDNPHAAVAVLQFGQPWGFERDDAERWLRTAAELREFARTATATSPRYGLQLRGWAASLERDAVKVLALLPK